MGTKSNTCQHNQKTKQNHEIIVVHAQSAMGLLSCCFEIYSPYRFVHVAALGQAIVAIICNDVVLLDPEITTLVRDSSFFEGVLIVVVDEVTAAGTLLVPLYGWHSRIFDDEASILEGAVKRAPSPTPASTTRKQSRTMRSSSSARKVPWGGCLVVLRSTHHIGSFTWPHWARQSSQSYAKLGFCLIQGNPQIPGARNTSSISVLIIVSVGL